MSGDLLDDLSFLDKTYKKPEFVYVGFWKRVVATILDLIAIGIVLALVEFIGECLAMVFPRDFVFSLFEFINLLIFFLYYPLLESSKHQATLGKMILGIKVINSKGKKIGFLQALARFFSKFISYTLLAIGFIIVAFAPKNQGFHDMICNTFVIENKK